MSVKSIRYSDDARGRLLRGIDTLARAVGATLGPKGRNVVVETAFGPPRTTKDGVSVAKEIDLTDHFENMGAQMLKEVAVRTSDLVGDGTTTATLLARAIVAEGFKAEAAGMNPMDLKRGIGLAVAAVVEDLERRSKTVETSEEIAQVGTTSSNGEEEIGHMIADAMSRVGKHGAITIEVDKGLETTVEVVEGMRFDSGYVSPYFVTDTQRLICDLEKPLILLHETKLSGLQPLLPLLEKVAEAGRPLLIVAEAIEGEALATLVVNRLRGGLEVAAVKAPQFGDQRKAALQDMAVLTGGQVLTEDLGAKLESFGLDDLGQAGRVQITKDETTILAGQGHSALIEARCNQIRSMIEESRSDNDREKLEQRLAKLAGGVAVIRVGGATEVEVKEKRDRIEDAMNATRAAVEEGILPGGGVALLNAGAALRDIAPENHDQQVGIEIVAKAIQAPIRQIAANAGLDGAVIAAKVLDQQNPNLGFDAQENRYRDLLEAGIIDPTKVVRIALQDAASVASILVTTEAMVADAQPLSASTADAPSDMAALPH